MRTFDYTEDDDVLPWNHVDPPQIIDVKGGEPYDHNPEPF